MIVLLSNAGQFVQAIDVQDVFADRAVALGGIEVGSAGQNTPVPGGQKIQRLLSRFWAGIARQGSLRSWNRQALIHSYANGNSRPGLVKVEICDQPRATDQQRGTAGWLERLSS